ncbi:OLC1v1019476C1 [Oldenlandia corymbosa var. corymbosa]|uniref:OLC1v1019476C1 n=1 Tax=Oldenlandia corymbosa var. corymbosa TaxID=529605 RepID=A0AAV1EE07_OLDCO|nr:OLC1v1019476C1 [Oldenlandia corymbosa var. corymbosa]
MERAIQVTVPSVFGKPNPSSFMKGESLNPSMFREGRSGPLLLAPLTDGKPIQLGAFSVRDKTMYDLKWDLHEELHFVGSSHGWIIALDKSLDLLLYNFFSRESIYISEKSEIQGLADSRNTMNLKVNLIYKAVLTANPSGTSNETYRVVIIPHWCSKLASRGKSDAIWTVFGDADYYMDISCYDGILYAVADNGYTIEGWEFSKNSHYPSRKMSIKLNWDTDLSLSADYGPKLYLVPSKEEILYIERCIDELLNEEGEINWGYKTIKFRVFRLDRAEEKLVRVKSLKDQVIFLGGETI